MVMHLMRLRGMGRLCCWRLRKTQQRMRDLRSGVGSEGANCSELRPVGFGIVLASPAIPRLNDCPWRFRRQQSLQRHKNDSALLGVLLGFAERMS